MIERLKNWADGKKSHGAGLGLIVVGVAVLLGWAKLDPEQLQAALGIIGGAGLIALRAAVAKAAASIGTEGGLLSTAVQAVADQVAQGSPPKNAAPDDPAPEHTSPGPGD